MRVHRKFFILAISFIATIPTIGQEMGMQFPDSLLAKGEGLGYNSWVAVPMFFYQEETSFGGGVCGGYYFTSNRINRVSNIQGAALYTFKNQAKVTILPKIYTQDQEVYYSGHLRWSHYPDKFFGIGRNTPDSLEENFTSRGYSVLAQRQKVLFDVLMIGLQAGIDFSRMVDTDPLGELQLGTIRGSQRYFSSGIGVVATWDNRDNMFYATQGEFYKVTMMVHSRIFGSDFSYNRITSDLRQFYPLGSDHSLAFQLYGDFTWGAVPFQELPSVGGNEILRGYYQGRYRDRMMICAQAEYRYPLFWRVRGAIFVSAADVAPYLDKFSLKETRVTFGTGLRFRINPTKIHIRFDLGVTKDLKPAIYFTASEAF